MYVFGAGQLTRGSKKLTITPAGTLGLSAPAILTARIISVRFRGV